MRKGEKGAVEEIAPIGKFGEIPTSNLFPSVQRHWQGCAKCLNHSTTELTLNVSQVKYSSVQKKISHLREGFKNGSHGKFRQGSE